MSDKHTAVQPILLALDTSNQYCSIALQAHGQVWAQHELSEQKHSAMILPMVRALLADAAVELAEIDAVVVGVGPGGFTGVRLAVAVAQGLAFAMGVPVLAHASLEAMAVSAHRHSGTAEVVVAMDARMQQVYWAHYHFEDEQLHTRTTPSLDDVAVFAQRLDALQGACVLVGNAQEVFDEVGAACARNAITIAPIDHSAPHAEDFFPVANQSWSVGGAVPPEQVQPLYVRDKVAQTIAEREQGAAKA